MLNIDFDAVGNWAERRNLPYAGYTDLAQKPEVYQLIKECVEKVNADLSVDALLAGSQISRFLVLHKELDADDGELTPTNKVRRGFIAEKYQPLIDALYGGKSRAVHRNRREVGGRPQRQRERDTEDQRRPDVCTCESGRLMSKKIGDVILDVKNITLNFGGVKALSDISLQRQGTRDTRHHRPQRRRQSSMLNCINGVYAPQQGSITFRGQTFKHEQPPGGGDGRGVPSEPGAVQGQACSTTSSAAT